MSAITLLNYCLREGQLRNFYALAKHIKNDSSTIHRIYYGKQAVTPGFILCVHEHLHIPVTKIRELIAEE